MRVLIIGIGAMGKRYKAILKYLGVDFVECDLYNQKEIWQHSPKVDRAIIATPIDKHYEWCLWCISHKIDFLCEKPISKNIEQVKDLKMLCDRNDVDGRMVCNWAFVSGELEPSKNAIHFDYYNTGKDGFWDLIQPVYLDNGNSKFIFKSPFYICMIEGKKISQHDFDISYVEMIRYWIHQPEILWSMSDAIKATEKIIEWGKKNEKA